MKPNTTKQSTSSTAHWLSRWLSLCIAATAAWLIANATSAQAGMALLTTQLRLAQVGEMFEDNLILTTDNAFSAISVTGTPAGITAITNTKGSISFHGTPTTAGDYAIRITATTANNITQAFDINLAVFGTLEQVTSLAGTASAYCVVNNGGLNCWGYQQQVEGSAYRTALSALVGAYRIPPLSGVTAVAMTNESFCVIINDGVQCVGAWQEYDPRIYPTLPNKTYQIFPSGSSVSAIAINGGSACAIVASTVQCWGARIKAGTPSFVFSRTPEIVIASNLGISAISASPDGFCAVVNGGLTCWRTAGYGVTQPFTADYTLPYQVIDENSGITSVSGENEAICVIQHGGVSCWGSNTYGQVGSNDAKTVATRHAIMPPNSGATVLFAACTLAKASMWCWGTNRLMPNGALQLTDGTLASAIVAAENATVIPASLKPTAISRALFAGSTCFIGDSKLRCFGSGRSGALGNRSGIINPAPSTILAAGNDVTAASKSELGLCILRLGGIACAKNTALSSRKAQRDIGEFSDVIAQNSGVTQFESMANTMPTPMIDPQRVLSTLCAVIAGGLQCWGSNINGLLGNGTLTDSESPVPVFPPNSGVTAVSLANAHACAIVSSEVFCWGASNSGKLGIGVVPAGVYTSPQKVAALGDGVTAISAGYSATCAVKNGGLYCWGENRRVSGSARFSIIEVFISTALPEAKIAIGSGVTAVDVRQWPPLMIVKGGLISMAGKYLGPGAFDSLPDVLAINYSPLGSGVTSINGNCAVIDGGVTCFSDNGKIAASSGGGLGITTITGAVGLTRNEPCVIANGGIACYLTERVDPLRDEQYLYDQPTSVSTLPDMSPDRTPWYRNVSTPAEVFVLTNNPNEYATLAADKANYIAQGYVFSLSAKAVTSNGITASPVFKLYRSDIKLNVWTANFDEYQAMRKQPATFRDDGIDGYIFKQAGVTGTVPIYRFTRIGTAYELMVTNPFEYRFLINSPSWRIVREAGSNSDVMGYVFP